MSDERFNPLDYPLAFLYPKWVSGTSAWIEHIPFGMTLIGLLRPNVVVELGTHGGDSYCAMCQAIQNLGLPTRCTAVDTWVGDPHAGAYGPEVLGQLRSAHDAPYGSFSKLHQSTFDEALPTIQDGSVDLLHIDGLHTYDAVKHDFESWLPKMSRRGVVMFHDTQVRDRDFAVWKLWEELSPRFPHFEFLHGHGLGILAVGSEPPQALLQFFKMAAAQAKEVRGFFTYAGQAVHLLRDWRLLVVETHATVAKLAELFTAHGQPTAPVDLAAAMDSPYNLLVRMKHDMRRLLASLEASRA